MHRIHTILYIIISVYPSQPNAVQKQKKKTPYIPCFSVYYDATSANHVRSNPASALGSSSKLCTIR